MNEIFPYANILTGILILIVGFVFHWLGQLTSVLNWNFSTKLGLQEAELPKEYKVDYVALPKYFIGKTIKELDIRAKYSVTIIAIKKRMGAITGISEIPLPESILEDGDILIIVGKMKDVERFKREEIGTVEH